MVVLNDYDDVRSLHADLPKSLRTLKQNLQESTNWTVEGTTSHAVQVKLPSIGGYEQSVDILPAIDITRNRESVQNCASRNWDEA